jgi:hypothetical protein
VDVNKRIKSIDAQKHPWFNQQLLFQSNTIKKSRIIGQLKVYSQSKRLKKEALKIFLG